MTTPTPPVAQPFPVLLHPHPTLMQVAQPVAEVTPEVRTTLARMLATMYGADGVGLAANQIGVLQRLVVLDIGLPTADGKRDLTTKIPFQMVNPVITESSDERIIWEEGCLSLPDLHAHVERAARVTVSYLNEHGQPHTHTFEGLGAVCVQHEIDHLNGILFTQRVSKLKQQILTKRYARLRQEFLADPRYAHIAL